MILCGNQHEARTRRNRLRTGRAAKRREDGKHHAVRGEHAKANRGDNGGAEYEVTIKPTFVDQGSKFAGAALASVSYGRVFIYFGANLQSNRIDAPRY